jgi:polysaccharide deacetylase 2 family uncharacterized protein YibQ
MKQFLINYGWIIVLAVAYALYVYNIKKKYGKNKALETIRVDAYRLMLRAEKKWGTNNSTGKTKFNYVVDSLYKMLPYTAKVFLTQDELENFVQELYNKTKDYLDDGAINNSVSVE